MTNICEKYCSDLDDYRPIQSTLLTRFATADYSEVWRTTNQDYGAFYYQQPSKYCVPDNLKAKIYQRHERFQDWLSYQAKCQSCGPSLTTNSNQNNNNQTIFPSTRDETVRITHRKRFSPNCDECPITRIASSPCSENALIVDYLVRKIIDKLHYLINPDECHDVIECAQVLVSDLLNQEPSLCTEEIIDRVIAIMITPPDHFQQATLPNSFQSNISIEPTHCPSPQSAPDHCQMPSAADTIHTKLPSSTTVSISNACSSPNQALPLSNIFEKLTDLENAISKMSTQFVKP